MSMTMEGRHRARFKRYKGPRSKCRMAFYLDELDDDDDDDDNPIVYSLLIVANVVDAPQHRCSRPTIDLSILHTPPHRSNNTPMCPHGLFDPCQWTYVSSTRLLGLIVVQVDLLITPNTLWCNLLSSPSPNSTNSSPHTRAKCRRNGKQNTCTAHARAASNPHRPSRF
jgi:hypothetical protein